MNLELGLQQVLEISEKEAKRIVADLQEIRALPNEEKLKEATELANAIATKYFQLVKYYTDFNFEFDQRIKNLTSPIEFLAEKIKDISETLGGKNEPK